LAYTKSYDGLELPLGPAPVCGLKSLLCKEGRLVVPLAVSFCFFLRVDANSVRWRALCAPRALPGPPEGQVAMSSTQQPKLPYRQLSRAHTHWGPKQVGLLLGLGLRGPKQIGLPLGLGLCLGSEANRAPPWTRALGSKANRTPPWTRALGSAPGSDS
jgi:hypothetical protein